MKTMIRWLLLFGVVAALSTVTTREAAAGVSFSISVFDGPLTSHGYWIDRPGYGRCWRPAYVASAWRPYCEGYWMWTDYGWYWYSDEPWAWATYHYGRWMYDPYYGWVWVPGTEWGPSWVCWREGGGYVGWAPLSPACDFGPTGVLIVRERFVPARSFVFVQVGRFCEPVRQRTVIINNTTIINNTVNITKVTRVNNVVVNNGPKREVIEKVSSRKFTEAPQGFERPVIERPIKRPVVPERIVEKTETKVETPAPKSEQPGPKIIRPRPTPSEEKTVAKSEPVVKRPQPPAETEATEPRWLGRNRPSEYAPYPDTKPRKDQTPATAEADSVQPRRRVVRETPPQPPPAQQQQAGKPGQPNREDSEDQQRQKKKHGDRETQDN